MAEEEKALVKLAEAPQVALEAKRFEWEQLKAQANIVLKSGLAPDALDSADAILAVMLSGREVDVSPMLALREMYIVHGRVTMSAQLMQALVMRSGMGRIEIVESTKERALVRGTRTDIKTQTAETALTMIEEQLA